MTLKFALSTATAIGLLALTGAAWAGDDNNSYVNQQGAFNSADIDQSLGTNNQAGSAAQNITQVRTPLDLQVIKNNVLTITQSGDYNTVGLGSNPTSFATTPGVYQYQAYHLGSTWGTARNVLDITQTSDHNTVGAVWQKTETHVGNNSLTITQSGAGHNTVGSVSQYRGHTTPNQTNINQTGDNNTVTRVEQFANTFALSVAPANEIDVQMSGSDNGNGPLTGFALGSGAQSSTLIQGGPGNYARGSYAHVDIGGNLNQFGVTQYGDSNTVGTLLISGHSNEVGTYQNGDDNTIALAAVTGFGNNIGIRQTGDDNLATVGVTGDDNDIGVGQSSGSTATVTVTGGNNLLAVNQANGASATVTVWGSNNNRSGFTGGITSGLASSTPAALGGPLHAGDIVQDGASTIVLTVGLTGVSDGNSFALSQKGAGNSIVGTIDGGNNNEAVVTQNGASNTTNFSQLGGMNLVAIAQ